MDINDVAEPSYMLALAALLIELQPCQSIRLISALRAFLSKLSLHTDTHSNPSISALCSQILDGLDESETKLGGKDARTNTIRSNKNGSH
jgi:hypothetical protein